MEGLTRRPPDLDEAASKPGGMEELMKAEPLYVLGCPATRSGHDLISNTRYHKLNDECVAGKCQCILNNEEDGYSAQDVIKIPSITGDPKTVLPRFAMPNLDDKFVEQVLKKKAKKPDGKTVSPEPLFFDAAMWQQQFHTKYRKNMQQIDHVLKQMKELEKEIDSAYKNWEKDPSPDAKPGFKPTPKQQKQIEEQAALEEKAAETFEQFHNFQQVCGKMENTAQRFGLADYGEAKDLNCHLDPKEKDEAFKAMDKLEDLVKAKLGIGKDAAKATPPPKESAAFLDEWTAGPVAALTGPAVRQVLRPMQSNSITVRSHRYYKAQRAEWCEQASDFLGRVEGPLSESCSCQLR